MERVPLEVVEQFAAVFAGADRAHGMSAEEMIAFFRRFNPSVRGRDTYEMVPVRRDLFVTCLGYLVASDQWRALLDLATDPPQMKYGVPDRATLDDLRAVLFRGRGGLVEGVLVSGVTAPELHASWFKAICRLQTSPPAAITAARTMLEETCKRIVVERAAGDPDAGKGDLARTVKLACQALGIGHGTERELISGLAGASTALAGLSNEAGDRHGVLRTTEVALHDAEFVVSSLGAIAVFLMRRHHATPRSSGSS